jgi:hypothetical protein
VNAEARTSRGQRAKLKQKAVENKRAFVAQGINLFIKYGFPNKTEAYRNSKKWKRQ